MRPVASWRNTEGSLSLQLLRISGPEKHWSHSCLKKLAAGFCWAPMTTGFSESVSPTLNLPSVFSLIVFVLWLPLFFFGGFDNLLGPLRSWNFKKTNKWVRIMMQSFTLCFLLVFFFSNQRSNSATLFYLHEFLYFSCF